MSPYRNATLIMTDKCNLACTYCYIKKDNRYGAMDQETISASIKWFCTNLLKAQEDDGGFIFFGGEPLLENENITYAIELAKYLAKECGINFSYTVVTNGTLLTQKHLEYFIENKVHIQFSIDGMPIYHNENRKTKENEGSYQRISMLSDMVQFLKKGLSTSVNLVYTDKTINNLYDNYRYLFDCGFRDIRLRPVTGSMDNWNCEIIKREINKVVRHMIKQKNLRIYPFSNYYRDRDVINKPNEWERLDAELPCMVARNNFCIDQIGNIYPCHRFRYLDNYEEFCLGNVSKKVDEDRLDKFTLIQPRKKGFCSKCIYKYICDNQCLVAFYQKTGDLLKPDLNLCKLSKSVWKTFLNIVENVEVQ